MHSNYDDFLKKYHFKIHDKEKEANGYPFSSMFEKKIRNLDQEQEIVIRDFDKRYGSMLK